MSADLNKCRQVPMRWYLIALVFSTALAWAKLAAFFQQFSS
jgi:hypothetical protein